MLGAPRGCTIAHTVAGYSGGNMDAATLTPGRAAVATLPDDGRQTLAERVRAGSLDWHRPALAVLLGVTLLLRLWGIKQGLLYSYNVDEATHFVPRAISFFSHDLNPQYFLNPPAYSYLLQ